MLFIYLYHGDQYADLWKSDLYFRPTISALTENIGYSRTSPNGHLSTTATFFSPQSTKNPYIDSCLKPLYNGHFLLSQGGHCREVQLYTED